MGIYRCLCVTKGSKVSDDHIMCRSFSRMPQLTWFCPDPADARITFIPRRSRECVVSRVHLETAIGLTLDCGHLLWTRHLFFNTVASTCLLFPLPFAGVSSFLDIGAAFFANRC